MMSDADRPEAPFTSRSPCGRRTCAFHGTLERFDDRSVPSSWSGSRRTSANLQTEKLPRQANDESLTGALKEAISEVHCPDGAAHEPAERHRHPATSNGRLRAAGEVRRRRPGRDRAADALISVISVAFQGDLAAKRAIQIDEVDRRQRTGDRPPDQTDP